MSKDTQHLIVLSTCPDSISASDIARSVVTEKLAACVNIVSDISSCFIWDGKKNTANELLLIMKTTNHAYPALESKIKDMHPHELPEIIAVSIHAGLTGYLDWITNNTIVKE